MLATEMTVGEDLPGEGTLRLGAGVITEMKDSRTGVMEGIARIITAGTECPTVKLSVRMCATAKSSAVYLTNTIYIWLVPDDFTVAHLMHSVKI